MKRIFSFLALALFLTACGKQAVDVCNCAHTACPCEQHEKAECNCHECECKECKHKSKEECAKAGCKCCEHESCHPKP